MESFIHEFLHHAIHPVVIKQKEAVLKYNVKHAGVDDSYYLSSDDEGRLNAFEEYAVRKLSKDFVEEKYPVDLVMYLKELISAQ